MISTHHWLSQLVRLFQPRPRTIWKRSSLRTQAALRLEAIEDRCTPATLAMSTGVLVYTGGAVNNDFTIAVSGSNYVISDVVAITSVPSGWTGVGTPTVTGPTATVSSISVNLGAGTDVANIRSVAAGITITSSGNLTTNLSSNAPSNSGTLAGIVGNVTVTGSGSGTNAVVISNSSAATGSTSTITATQVTGMLPSGKTVEYSNFGRLRVIGSNLGADNFTVDVTSGSTALEVDTPGGNDTVAVQATHAATTINSTSGNNAATTINSTSGNDTVTVGTTGTGGVGLDNITGALLIDEAACVGNLLTITDAASTRADPNVQITPNSISGLAPVAITYQAPGGSFGGTGVTIDASNTAATAFTLAGPLLSSITTVNGDGSNMTVNGDGGNDSFTVATNFKANLNGGSGNDTFNLGGNGVVLTGSIIGGTGTNTLTYARRSTAVSVKMTGAATGTATGIVGTFSGISALVGGSGSNTLTGTNATTTWVVSGVNSGSITGGPSFTSFENLTGGSGADTFAFTGGSLSGSINGGAGVNTIDDSAAGSTAISLTGLGSAVGFAGTGPDIAGSFTNITTIIAAPGTSNSLHGLNSTATWTVDQVGENLTYSSGGKTLTFSNFQLLTGGVAADTFNLVSTSPGSIWTLNGGGGPNVFNVSNLANQNGSLTLLGGAGMNTLNVTDAADTNAEAWSVGVGNIRWNEVSIDYSGIENASVTTGSGAVSMDLEGSAVGSTLTLNLGGSSNQVGVGQISNLYGLAGSVHINLTNAASTSNVLSINDTSNMANEDWTVSDSLISRSNAASLAISGAVRFNTITMLGGDGGTTGNTFAVIASAASAITVDGGVGTNNSLIVHTGSSTGTDNGSGQITFTGPSLEPVDYSDFEYAPVIVT
jgi:hypothetical protein